MLVYKFKKKHNYKLTLNGRTKYPGNGRLVIALANEVYESANTTCVDYALPPNITDKTECFNEIPVWPSSYSSDLEAITIRPTKDYAKIWIYTYVIPNSTASASYYLNLLTIVDQGDPTTIYNNSIATLGGQTEIVGNEILNLNIIGSNPAGGGNIAQTIPLNGYRYQWQISINDGEYTSTGVTTKDFVLNTRNAKTKLKRIVYTDDYPEGVEGNELVINLTPCIRSSHGSNQICDNQNIYNCIPDQTYTFNTAIGATFVTSATFDYYFYKSVWRTSRDLSTWTVSKISPTTTDASYNANMLANTKINDYAGLSLKKSWWPNYDIIYLKREIEEKETSCWFIDCGWKSSNKQSNIIKLGIYSFDNPDNTDLHIKGEANLSCSNPRPIFELWDNKTKTLVDIDTLGIKNIKWYYDGQSNSGKWARQFQPENIHNELSNIPIGGNVSATVTFEDGKVKTYTFTTIAPVTHLVTTNPSSNLSICAYSTVNVTSSVTGGSGNVTYSWDKWYAKCLNTNCNSISINGLDLVYDDVLNLKVTDNTTSCYTNNAINLKPEPIVDYGRNTWNEWDIYTGLYQQPSLKQSTDIVFEKLGNPYYVGSDQKIWYYQYTNSKWLNLPIASTFLAIGPLAIYEPTTGNRTLYFARQDKKLYTVTATGGLMNWGAISIVNGGIDVSGCIKISATGKPYYRHANNTVGTIINNVYTPIVNVKPGSNFELVGNILYYVSTTNSGVIAAFNILTNSAVSLSGWNENVLPGTVITSDLFGSVYYTGADNIIYQIKTQVITGTNSSFKSNGRFSVNKETAVIYAAGIDHNIYQIYYSNGWWNTPLLLSINFNTGNWPNLGGAIGDELYAETLAQYGAVVFRNPNAFYVSADGQIRVIQYSTTNNCIAAHVRISNESVNQDNISIENKGSQLDYTLYASPNPVTEYTKIKVNLKEDARISVSLVNSLGIVTDVYVNEQQYTKGEHQINLQSNNIPSGVYVLLLKVNGVLTKTTKLLFN